MVTVALVLWTAGSALTLLASGATSAWPTVLLVWAGIAALIAIWSLLEERPKSLARVRSYEDSLRQNEAHVVRIQSDEIVAFEEQEDEGARYAFQVGDRIVFVAGQDFYPSTQFPNSDFSLVEITDSRGTRVELLMDSAGKKLQPMRTIAAEQQAKLRIPEHLEILQGKLEDIDRLLAE